VIEIIKQRLIWSGIEKREQVMVDLRGLVSKEVPTETLDAIEWSLKSELHLIGPGGDVFNDIHFQLPDLRKKEAKIK
jgi:hypothetical protein